jgi:hypothetical protein
MAGARCVTGDGAFPLQNDNASARKSSSQRLAVEQSRFHADGPTGAPSMFGG